MNRKTIFIITSILMVCWLVVDAVRTSSKNRMQEAQQKAYDKKASRLEDKKIRQGLTLNEEVSLAKLQGKKEIRYPQGQFAFYTKFKSFNDALSACTIVTAHPIAMRSYLSKENTIGSCYKFKKGQVLSEAPPSQYPFAGKILPEVEPRDEDEFVVCKSGGNINIEGVDVIGEDKDLPSFDLTKDYLLLIEFDATKRIGGLCMGAIPALEVDDNKILKNIGRPQNGARDIEELRDGISLEQLKTEIKKIKTKESK